MIKPYPSFKKRETKLPEILAIEETVRKCEKAFSNLEKNLYPPGYDSDDYYSYHFNDFSEKLRKLSEDVLNADKSFSNLKYQIERSTNYSLHTLDYGKEIEYNLEELKRKISLYEMLESKSCKVATCVGVSSIPALPTGFSIAASEGAAAGAAAGLAAALFTCIAAGATIATLEKNIITLFVERSHYPFIKNIVKYSEPFFYDLNEKLKSRVKFELQANDGKTNKYV